MRPTSAQAQVRASCGAVTWQRMSYGEAEQVYPRTSAFIINLLLPIKIH